MSDTGQPNPRQENSALPPALPGLASPIAMTADPSRAAERGAGCGNWIVAALWLGWGGFFPFNVIPKFQGIFKDMFRGQVLPVLTEFVLWMNPIGWALIANLMVGALIYQGARGARGAFRVWAAVLLIVLTALIVIGLFLPIISITEVLSSGD